MENSHIRELRLKLGLTQLEFAVMLGVVPSTVSLWENGHRKPQKYLKREIERIALKQRRHEEYERGKGSD